RAGTILKRLLPAGSVTGAPKKRTGEIIREAEGYERGWYTGVFGVFNGRSLDSAVMIRFVEKSNDGKLVYKSGGGITIYSDMEAEYAELEAKIYAPVG
ncbi:MAG: chorismate-binding protein, partial [Spirochaetaceae bacterium]|nr:chorismate-binding protein [Spirochaetaceae bacterium]